MEAKSLKKRPCTVRRAKQRKKKASTTKGMDPLKTRKQDNPVTKMKMDVSNIHLDGEEAEDVPVYDTCDEVRKKIRAYLCEGDITQALFRQEIAKTLENGRKIQSNMLNQFLDKTGPRSGNLSSVFYASYVFFEKIRIKDGEPKTPFREAIEKIWNGDLTGSHHKSGFDRTTRSNTAYFCEVDYVVVADEYGCTTTIHNRFL